MKEKRVVFKRYVQNQPTLLPASLEELVPERHPVRVVVLLAEQGVLSLKELTLDGTKISGDANRYTFVWGKAITVSRERIARQLKELWAYVEEVYRDEEEQPNTPDIEKIDPEAVEQTIREINEALREKEIDPKVRQKLNYAKKNWPGKLREYEQKEKLQQTASFRHTGSTKPETAMAARYAAPATKPRETALSSEAQTSSGTGRR